MRGTLDARTVGRWSHRRGVCPFNARRLAAHHIGSCRIRRTARSSPGQFGGPRHEEAHPCHRCRGRFRCHPSPRLSDAPGRSPNHGFDRSGQSDDVRHADGYSPSPATGPDDPAHSAGSVHGQHVPVLSEHGHDAAPARTTRRHAGHAWDAEHARHAAGRAHKSSGIVPGSGNAQAKLITLHHTDHLGCCHAGPRPSIGQTVWPWRIL